MINRVFLTGNLGSNPGEEIESGVKKQKFILAVNKYYLNSNHERQKKTDWFKVYYWGKTKLEKGSQVFVEGQISYDENKKPLIKADYVKVFE